MKPILYRIDKTSFLEYSPGDIYLSMFIYGRYAEVISDFYFVDKALGLSLEIEQWDLTPVNKGWYVSIDTEEWWRELFTEESLDEEANNHI